MMIAFIQITFVFKTAFIFIAFLSSQQVYQGSRAGIIIYVLPSVDVTNEAQRS